jgi:hypothetical protein
MAMDQAKNGARATIASGITAGATSITLTTGHGARMPSVPFNAWIYNSTDYPLDPHDDPSYEIIRVTARSTDTLTTVIRAQEGTAAAAHNTSGKTYRLVAGLTAKVINTDLPTFFSRYREREYDVRNYLAGGGVTDDTAALQEVFDAIGTDKDNGTIYFDDDTYLIAGALQEGSRRNAQLLLPTQDVSDPQYTIRFKGHSVPMVAPSGYHNVGQVRGTRIKSSLASGSGTQPSVITGRGPVSGMYSEAAYYHVEMEDMIWETVPNPSYSCLNFERISTVGLRNCLILAGPYIDLPRAVQPTNGGSYGIILPRDSNGICQKLEGEVNVFGFYWGIRCGELMHAQNIGVWWCQYGLEFPFSYHGSLIQRLLVFWCPYGAAFSNTHAVQIIQWDNEHTQVGESAWYASVWDVYDPSNVADGNITWITIQASLGRVSNFTVSGGAGLQIKELGT